VHADRTWSYPDLATSSRALASAMDAAGLAGERVALMLPNGPEALLAYLACFEVGAVATPLNSRYAPPEIEAVLGRARAAVDRGPGGPIGPAGARRSPGP
jgi:long-chain acyl-CoA synthetase